MPWFIIFCIIIERLVGAPGQRNDVVAGINARHKQIFKSSTANILNPELICD